MDNRKKNMEMPESSAAFVFSGDPVEPTGTDALIHNGKSLVKSEAGFHTAIAVQRPRDLNKVVSAVEKEAALAGENFYYTWRVKSRNSETGESKKSTIEGGTIGLALCIAREWGNCAVLTDVHEERGSWFFLNSFVDLERGFTIQRNYRKTIPRSSAGKYDRERWEDMQFQKAQSQGIRNIIFNGAPRWLQKRAIDVAKQAVIRGITAAGLEKSKERALAAFSKLGISQKQLETYLDSPLVQWGIDDLQDLKSILTQIENGDVSIDEAFETEKKMESAPEKTVEPEKEKPKPEEQPKEERKDSEAANQKMDEAICPKTHNPLSADECAICKDLATCNAMGSPGLEKEKPKPSDQPEKEKTLPLEKKEEPKKNGTSKKINIECKTRGAHPGRKVHLDYCMMSCPKRKGCPELAAEGIEPVLKEV